MSEAPVLSVIFVNYRSGALLLDAVRTLLQFNGELPMEIIVADNSPDPSDSSLLNAHFPQVQWIGMGYNAGFARANNRGMKAARAPLLLLLNPDTLCTGRDIALCARRMLDDKGIAAAGVQLEDRAGQPQISGHRFVPWGLNHLLPLPYWGALLKRAVLLGGGKAPHKREAAAAEEVDWISGACLMVSRRAWERAGGMDEDFFLYAEEVEWCSRLRKQGRMVVFGDLRLVHLEGGSIDAAARVQERGYYNLYDRKGLQLMVSNHLRVRKQYGAPAFVFLLLNYTWGVPFFLVAGFLDRLFRLSHPFSHVTRVAAFGANVLRLWRLAPSILLHRHRLYNVMSSSGAPGDERSNKG